MARIALALFFLAAVPAAAGGESPPPPAGKPQATCPVLEGRKIDRKFFADHAGKRVYFCCPACPDIFKKDPSKDAGARDSSGTESCR